MFDQTYTIARKSLEDCFEDGKVVASPTHFSDFWARDTFFAVPGLLAIGAYERVQTSLKYFLDLQHADGRIPRKIATDINSIKYLTGKRFRRKNPKPVYSGVVPGIEVMDANSLMLIATGRYLEATRDYDFADAYYRKLQDALHFYDAHIREGFIYERGLANWMDTIFKTGPVFYTNVLYVQALEAMILICQVAGHDDDAEVYVHRARAMKKRLQKQFWSGKYGYFVDQFNKLQSPTFDAAGNLLAVAAGVASDEQSRQIIAFCQAENTSWISAVPTGHKWYKVNPVLGALGMRDYHTRTHWSWIGALYVRALAHTGQNDDALKVLRDYEQVFVRDGELGETYDLDGAVYKRFLWQSAIPFAWGSAMMIESLVALGLQKADSSYKKPEQRIC